MKNCLRMFFIFSLIFMSGINLSEAGESAAKSKEMAPDLRLQDLNQETVVLSGHKQPLVLFFWTSWCPYCRKELKELKDVYPRLVKEGWELFAINVGESEYKVSKIIKDSALNFKVLLDKDGVAAYSYDVLGVPAYFIVDREGHIVFEGNSFPKDTYRQLAH